MAAMEKVINKKVQALLAMQKLFHRNSELYKAISEEIRLILKGTKQ